MFLKKYCIRVMCVIFFNDNSYHTWYFVVIKTYGHRDLIEDQIIKEM